MDRGLFFLILALCCIWLVIDDVLAQNAYISFFVSGLGDFFGGGNSEKVFSDRRINANKEMSEDFLNSDKTTPTPFMKSVKDRLLNKNNNVIGFSDADRAKMSQDKLDSMYDEAMKGIAEANAHAK